MQCILDCVAGGVALLPGHMSTLHITADVVARQLDVLPIETRRGPVAELAVPVGDDRSGSGVPCPVSPTGPPGPPAQGVVAPAPLRVTPTFTG